METEFFTVLNIGWCAIWQRLRGGALTTLTGWNPGRDGARGSASLAIALLIFACDRSWFLLLIAPLIFFVLKLTGWEEFELMGLEDGTVTETENPNFWVRWLPRKLGFKLGMIPYDLVGMAQTGLVLFFLVAVFFLALKVPAWSDWPLMVGLVLGLPYLLARPPLLNISKFVVGPQWEEVFAGAAIWFVAS